MTPRMDSSAITPAPPAPPPRFEAWAVLVALCLISTALHGPALLAPSQFIFSPADIMGRQPELAGQAEFEPANRLLIDPVLQFEPWDNFTRHELGHGRFPFWNPYSGAGAPFAGNGQSQLFDPIKSLFRLMPAPWAWAAEHAFRFVLTGFGMYATCRFWQLGRATRLFCALALPLSGFFTLWRLYPLVATASVIPWLWLAFERLWHKPTPRRTCLAGLTVAWLIAAGNVQIAAVGLLSTFWLWLCGSRQSRSCSPLKYSCIALGLGLCLSAPAWVSLADYLQLSPIWADRIAEHTGQGRGSASRWADLPTLVAPFLYGSERQGDPNFHKALGAGNVNEAASGYTGMFALILLIPLALAHSPTRSSKVGRFAIGIWLAGLWIGYRLPPVPWAWPHLPVLQGIDPRRFVVAASLGGTLLSGIGLQRLIAVALPEVVHKQAIRFWLVLAVFFIMAAAVPWLVKGKLQVRAERHYEQSIDLGPNHAELVKTRVASQVKAITRTWPVYMLGRSCLLPLLILIWRLTTQKPQSRCLATGTLAVLELFQFGWNYNPQVARSWLESQQQSALIKRLKHLATTEQSKGHEARFLALGEALPPNQLMRFGLKDIRNYDSIELQPCLAALDPLFEHQPGQDRTSRRPVTWAGVGRAKAILQTFSVVGVVAHSPPPDGLFDHVEQPLPGTWLGTWPGRPRAEGLHGSLIKIETDEPGMIRLRMNTGSPTFSKPAVRQAEGILIREIYTPGWHVRGPEGSAWQILQEPESGMIQLIPPPGSTMDHVELTFRPRHWGLSLWALTTGGGIIVWLLVKERTDRSEIRKKHFSSPDAPRYYGILS